MRNKNFLGFLVIVLLFGFNNLSAELPYYLDFKYILNQSDAGKKAQTFLKKIERWNKKNTR